MQGMWQILNTIQLFYLLLLFNYSYPGNVLFFVKPFDTATINVPVFSSAMEWCLDFSGLDLGMLNHPPLNEKFEEYGHDSTSVLFEAADTILIILAAALLFF